MMQVSGEPKLGVPPGVVSAIRQAYCRNMTVANLHNTKTDRYHPILFREAPQPSHAPGDTLVRSKSVGHHTAGFDTREESLAECASIAESQSAKQCVGRDFEWDGEDVPAMIVFFTETDGEIVPIMF